MRQRETSWFPIFLIVLLFTVISCNAVSELPRNLEPINPFPSASQPSSAPPATVSSDVTPTACPNGDCANACLSKLSAIPPSNGSAEKLPKIAGGGASSALAVTLATYPVKGNELGKPRFSDQAPPELSALQHDEAQQRKIWEYFAAIIPADQRSKLVYFIVSTDGKAGMLASVEQFSGPSDSWALVVDPADASRPRDLTATLLHEFGHLLTLNSSQVTPDQKVLQHPDDLQIYGQEAASCPSYFASGGCSQSGSYINQFFDTFWTKIYGEWSAVSAARKKSNYLTLLSRFYRSHPSQFITPYAATSPEEDMAESWSYFVLNRKPEGDSIANKKVLFFYGFPELVDLRNEIISNMCTYAGSQ